MATGNPDYTREVAIPTHGRLIVGVRVYERHFSVLIDLVLDFDDGSFSPRALADSDSRCADGTYGGWRTWEIRLPPQHFVYGFDARIQDHYGIVDLLLRV